MCITGKYVWLMPQHSSLSHLSQEGAKYSNVSTTMVSTTLLWIIEQKRDNAFIRSLLKIFYP